MAATLCDSCKVSSASLFCRADSAFLCIPCDGMVHAGNKLESRHKRVWMCEVCEQAPASITCKADAAALCVTCDRDIHSANPLARRHERFPVVPFYDSAAETTKIGGGGEKDEHHYLLNFDVNVAGSEDLEAEAASWLLQNPNLNKIGDGSDDDDDLKVTESEPEYLFNEIDPYLNIDLKTPEKKLKPHQILRGYTSPTDGVVPVQIENDNHDYQILQQTHASEYVVEGLPAFDSDYAGFKPFMYNFKSQSISQSVSSSSLEIDVSVVPGHTTAMADESNHNQKQESLTEVYPTPAIGLDREARVLRYREKRKNRKFEKTIRYASRKAYAETRPRIKGRFAKRTEIDIDAIISPESSYGVVPSY